MRTMKINSRNSARRSLRGQDCDNPPYNLNRNSDNLKSNDDVLNTRIYNLNTSMEFEGANDNRIGSNILKEIPTAVNVLKNGNTNCNNLNINNDNLNTSMEIEIMNGNRIGSKILKEITGNNLNTRNDTLNTDSNNLKSNFCRNLNTKIDNLNMSMQIKVMNENQIRSNILKEITIAVTNNNLNAGNDDLSISSENLNSRVVNLNISMEFEVVNEDQIESDIPKKNQNDNLNINNDNLNTGNNNLKIINGNLNTTIDKLNTSMDIDAPNENQIQSNIPKENVNKLEKDNLNTGNDSENLNSGIVNLNPPMEIDIPNENRLDSNIPMEKANTLEKNNLIPSCSNSKPNSEKKEELDPQKKTFDRKIPPPTRCFTVETFHENLATIKTFFRILGVAKLINTDWFLFSHILNDHCEEIRLNFQQVSRLDELSERESNPVQIYGELVKGEGGKAEILVLACVKFYKPDDFAANVQLFKLIEERRRRNESVIDCN